MTKGDQEALESAVNSCGRIYLRSPCLKVFEKRSENNYWAICSSPEGENLEEFYFEIN